MAPLPPNNTARLWVDYEVASFDHTALIRVGSVEEVDEAIDLFTEIVEAIGDFLFLSTFIGARFAASGSNVSNPIAGAWPTSWGNSSNPQRKDSAAYVGFVGRSLDGRRSGFELFGSSTVSLGGDYRATTAENAGVNTAVSLLNGAEGTFLSINQFQPIWKPYVNLGINAYWRNHIR